METAQLQNRICETITDIGGKIKWKKELGLPARIYYAISKKEPVINIEAFFLGERFAVIIGKKPRNITSRMFNSSGYRIIICTTFDDFKIQFEEFKNQKLSDV